jgi:uncharacterized protein YceK
MHGKVLMAFAALVVIGMSGCGTICNFVARKGDPEVYGGVLYDMEGHVPLHFGVGSGDPRGLLLVLAWIPVEFGLSFVGDTVTLPLVIAMRHEDQPPDDDDPPPSPPCDNTANDRADAKNPAVLGPPLPLDQSRPEGEQNGSKASEPVDHNPTSPWLWRPLIEDFAQPPQYTPFTDWADAPW